MLQVTYRKHGIRLSHVWFADKEQLSNEEYRKEKADLYYIHGVESESSKIKEYESNTQFSLIKNLSVTEDELFLSLGKHLRQYIKRSNKEGFVDIIILDGKRILSDSVLVDTCQTLYEKMFFDKGMHVKFNKNLFLEYAMQNALVLGVACVDGVTVGFDAVIFKEKKARLWLAAFDFRNNTNDAQVLSRGHQRLDWEMLLWCKNSGVESYDFGGVNSFDNPNGIAKFKMAFEKKNKIKYRNYVVAGNGLGKVCLIAKKFVKK